MRELFLAMIDSGSSYGYEIKQSLEGKFGDLLPEINAGQVYTTLTRLYVTVLSPGKRFLATTGGSASSSRTAAGKRALREWVESPSGGHNCATSSCFSSSWRRTPGWSNRGS